MFRRIMTDIDITRNLKVLKEKISSACSKRSAEFGDTEPCLVAVSKTKPKELVVQAYEAGQRHFGENYVQEIFEKGTDEEIIVKCSEIKWHFIGHLQKNKVNKLLSVSNLYVVETIDSLKLATAVNNAWQKLQPTENKLNIFVQVNTSGEEEKSGCKPEEAVALVQEIKEQCQSLNILGLMTIGKYDNYGPVEGINPDFKSLLDLRVPVAKALDVEPLKVELSMGMSADFEHAIEVGSTNVRVGTAIFGQRDYTKMH